MPNRYNESDIISGHGKNDIKVRIAAERYKVARTTLQKNIKRTTSIACRITTNTFVKWCGTCDQWRHTSYTHQGMENRITTCSSSVIYMLYFS